LMLESELLVLAQRGRCVGSASPELFFPSESGPASGLEAKRICARCVVKAACLRFALVTDQRWGVWGGTSAYERRRLSRELVEAGVVEWIAGQGEA
jgi:WhiB family transcriptional regulator, redox-sensing transcriptional regulator